MAETRLTGKELLTSNTVGMTQFAATGTSLFRMIGIGQLTMSGGEPPPAGVSKIIIN